MTTSQVGRWAAGVGGRSRVKGQADGVGTEVTQLSCGGTVHSYLRQRRLLDLVQDVSGVDPDLVYLDVSRYRRGRGISRRANGAPGPGSSWCLWM